MLCGSPSPCVHNIYLFKSTVVFQHYVNIDKNSILTDAQHGVRKKHTCQTQLITIIEDMACNISSSTQIVAVCLDLTKAFYNASISSLNTMA